MMEITEARAGRTTTLRIVGRIDSSVARTFEQKIHDVTARDEDVVVDLAALNYISSAGLRSFIVLAKQMRAKEKTIALCGMHEEVSEIFEISGLLPLFVLYDSVESAIAALQR